MFVPYPEILRRTPESSQARTSTPITDMYRLQSQPPTRCTCRPVYHNEIVPQLDILVYKSRYRLDEDIAEYKKYALYFPNICLVEPTLYFPNIRILEFEHRSFIQHELSKFLISHKRTLRDLTLKRCLFQAESQQWSPIFQSELSLIELSFDGPKQYNRHRCILWLRVNGDIRSGFYRDCGGVTGLLDS